MTTRVHDLKVSVAEILGTPGQHRDLVLREPVGDIRVPLARLTEGPIEAQLRLESVVEGILVTGRITGTAMLECARCLTRFASEIALDVCELFAAPGHAEEDDDAYRFTDAELDLEPMLRDAITLSLPLNPLCKDACAGMCAQCGRDLNQGPCECRTTDTDPRWAALDELRARLDS